MDVFRIEWHCKSSFVLLEDGLQWKYVHVTNLHFHEHPSKVCILNFHILYIKFNIRRSFRDLQISLNLTSDVAFVIYRTTLGLHRKIYYVFSFVIYNCKNDMIGWSFPSGMGTYENIKEDGL